LDGYPCGRENAHYLGKQMLINEAGIDSRKFEQLRMYKNLDPISGANVSTIPK
jgi:hypothetical protein